MDTVSCKNTSIFFCHHHLIWQIFEQSHNNLVRNDWLVRDAIPTHPHKGFFQVVELEYIIGCDFPNFINDTSYLSVSIHIYSYLSIFMNIYSEIYPYVFVCIPSILPNLGGFETSEWSPQDLSGSATWDVLAGVAMDFFSDGGFMGKTPWKWWLLIFFSPLWKLPLIDLARGFPSHFWWRVNIWKKIASFNKKMMFFPQQRWRLNQ